MLEGGTGVKLDLEGRQREVLPMLRKYATQGEQYVILHAPVEFYVGRDVTGFVPYLQSGRLLLGICEPLCAPGDRRQLAEEYLWFAKRRGQVPSFFPVSQHFFEEMSDLGFGGVETAREPVVHLGQVDWNCPEFEELRAEADTIERKWSMEWVSGKRLSRRRLETLKQLERAWGGPVGDPQIFPFFAAQPSIAMEERQFVLWLDEGEVVGAVSLVALGTPGTQMVEGVFLDPDVDLAFAGALMYRALQGVRKRKVKTLTFGPIVLDPSPRDPLEGLPQDGEFPMVASVTRWVLGHVPALEQYLSAQRIKLILRPHELEPRFLMFHPARPTPDLLLSFVRAVFPGMNFKGLVQEVWAGFSKGLLQRTEMTKKEE